MTARAFYTLLCDVHGCFTRVFSSNKRTVAETRADGRERGWRHLRVRRPHGGPARSIDLCPEHGLMSDEDVIDLIERLERGLR